MTYIIAEPCIDIKDLSCVDVCPVDCIHEFERILIIDPEECIDREQWLSSRVRRVRIRAAPARRLSAWAGTGSVRSMQP